MPWWCVGAVVDCDAATGGTEGHAAVFWGRQLIAMQPRVGLGPCRCLCLGAHTEKRFRYIGVCVCCVCVCAHLLWYFWFLLLSARRAAG